MTGSFLAALPPALPWMLGALLLPFLRGPLRQAAYVALPALGLAQVALWFGMEPGDYHRVELFGQTLTLLRLDRLSLAFGLIFAVALLLGAIYGLHVRDWKEQIAGLIYAFSAIGAVFAGDLVTLFLYWEGTAIASVFLIWARGGERAFRAGMRYLVIQVGSGVLLLAGMVFRYRAEGNLDFDGIGLDGAGGLPIFLAFGIKCAFPFLHNWLQDSYPEATVAGTVFLSAFTTKLAVYALARGFAGTEILIGIGLTMTLFPIFFAVIENDLRRVLAYSLNNQLGFMVVGIGVGSELALNGTVAHAFCHILYKALLFMSMGAILHRVGTTKASELGGLHKSMPWTAAFCVVGAMSISAFPLFSGFVSKSLILTAVAENHLSFVLLGLVFASAGVMEHSGIKIPFFGFFGHDSGKRCKEAPWHMLVAMGATAFLCVAIGVFPGPLYSILPYAVDYEPYTASHVLTQLQLLLFAALAFGVLLRTGLYPKEIRSTNLDFDWFYRRLGPDAVRIGWTLGGAARGVVTRAVREGLGAGIRRLDGLLGPSGTLPLAFSTGATALWVVVTLVVFLLLYFL